MTVTPSILHQGDTEAVINVEIEQAEIVQDTENDAEFAKKGVVVIASPTADAASLKTAVDAIRAQLTASGVTG